MKALCERVNGKSTDARSPLAVDTDGGQVRVRHARELKIHATPQASQVRFPVWLVKEPAP